MTKRGLLAVAVFVICWLLILRYPVSQAVSLLNSPNVAEFAESALGAVGLSKLLSWPEAELAVYWLIALYSFPNFCLFLCADQTVGDRQRGTMRFLILRATRSEIIFGRFFGQVLIVAVLLLLTLIATLAMLSYREPTLLAPALALSSQLFVYLIVAVLPFIALMSLLNTFASSARIAFILAILVFAGGSVILGLLIWQIPALEALNSIFPGYQLNQMAGQNAGLLLSIGLPVAQTLVLLMLARHIFARSAI